MREKEGTHTLMMDFLRDQFKWIGGIQQANRIGKWIDGERDKHIRDILKNVEDKSIILRNRRFLKRTHFYLDELFPSKKKGRSGKRYNQKEMRGNGLG